MEATVIFNYNGAVVIVNKPKPAGNTPHEVCSMIASALILFNRAEVISYDEFREAIGFLGSLPSHEKLSAYLSNHLVGLIWTEIPLNS